jgi:hypothetical protein
MEYEISGLSADNTGMRRTLKPAKLGVIRGLRFPHHFFPHHFLIIIKSVGQFF